MKLLSKTKIKVHLRKKRNPELAETIKIALKSSGWLPISKVISGPSRRRIIVNLKDIEKKTTLGDTIVVPGKVLSLGEISKKIKICALSISQSALVKLKKTKSEYSSLLEEIKTNPKAQGVKIIT